MKKKEVRIDSLTQQKETTALARGMSPEDITSLLHDLRSHQIRLEEQNEELRLAQIDLLLSRDQYSDLYDAAPVGYLTLDLQGSICQANLTTSDMLNVERESLIGQLFQRFIFSEDADTFDRLCKKLDHPGDAGTCELRINAADGSFLHVHLRCISEEQGIGNERFFRLALTDISDRKESEAKQRQLSQKLEQTQRVESLGVLAGGIAHDFNNLLVGIIVNADLVADELGPHSPLQKNVQQIQTAAARSAELCNQMLAYSGKGNFEKTVFDLSQVIREMGELLQSVVSSKITLKYELANELPGIEGDATSVRQIVMNLIVNAAEAIDAAPGTVSVTTSLISVDREYLASTYIDDELRAGDYVCLEVIDTGCGIDEQSMPRIFDPFFTTKFAGRGLGMAAVLGIIRSHQGAIEVKSQPGQGTLIRVLFPASPQSLTGSDASSSLGKVQHDKKTILVVDDEEVVRLSMQALLQTNGYRVLTAVDGQSAIELVPQHADEIAVVLLDLTMPGLSASQTCESLRRIAPDISILLMSGFSEQEALSKFQNQNIAGFVQKPRGDVVSAVREILQADITERR